MSVFLAFIKKIYFIGLFVLLECVAVNCYTSSSVYTNAQLMKVSRFFVGPAQESIYNMKTFVLLGKENERLSAEVTRLNNFIAAMHIDSSLMEEGQFMPNDSLKYSYLSAKVVNNSYVKQNNYITLNKGSEDGVAKDMSIVCNGAIVGYILDCSNHYSVGISMLNIHFKTSGKNLSGTYNGSISWKGDDIKEVLMTEIPKYADINIGDTIVTTNFSSRFPENIRIGVIKSFELINATYNNAVVEIFSDFNTLRNVQIIKFKDFDEKTTLENEVEQHAPRTR